MGGWLQTSRRHNHFLNTRDFPNSAFLDIETPTKIARITLWGTGSCDREVLEVSGGKQITWENSVFSDWPEAKEEIGRFIETVL